MSIFTLPDLGEGLAEAEIREWFVKPGDSVEIDQPLVAVETAKAVVEVPSPQKGVVKNCFGDAGDIIPTHAPLVEFEGEAGTVAGVIEVGDTVIEESATGVVTQTTQTQIQVSPAVRRLAKQLNVDLNHVTGSGPDGAITLQDVKQATPSDDIQVETLHSVRRQMAINMQKSHSEIVPVTLHDMVKISEADEKLDLTITFLRAIAHASRVEPALNAHYDGQSFTRTLFKNINVGVAIDSPEGLFVPVLKNISEQDDEALRSHIDRFKTAARDRSFTQEELRGPTIVLSNFGTIAGRYANPIILPPTVCIIGTGKIHDAVLAENNRPIVRKVLPISLSFDHRAVTGGEACRFLEALICGLDIASM